MSKHTESRQLYRLDVLRKAIARGDDLSDVRDQHPSFWESTETGYRRWRRDVVIATRNETVMADVVAARRRVLRACLPCTIPEAMARCPDLIGVFRKQVIYADLVAIGAVCTKRQRAPGVYSMPSGEP